MNRDHGVIEAFGNRVCTIKVKLIGRYEGFYSTEDGRFVAQKMGSTKRFKEHWIVRDIKAGEGVREKSAGNLAECTMRVRVWLAEEKYGDPDGSLMEEYPRKEKA